MNANLWPLCLIYSLRLCCQLELQELLPGIINQLGPDNLANLKKIAESYQVSKDNDPNDAANDESVDSDDDVPDLVENFEDISNAD